MSQSEAPLPASAAPTKKGGLRYQPGLDGLRALCVLSILLYHADVPWLPGGFLGVEVFFVLSGFLITSLLRAEVLTTGRVDLVDFWRRRALRLLPALWATLFAVSLYSVCFLPEELWRLRGEVVAGLVYVSNWYLAWGEQSYFEQVGRPSLLKHLWSLAIEEQFYLVFPVIYALCARRFQARTLAASAGLLALGSSCFMGLSFVEGEDPSGLYYHSGARAAAMLLGALLATLFQPDNVHPRLTRFMSKPVLSALGAFGLGGILLSAVGLSEADTLVFRGGLVLVDVCALLVIFAVVYPAENPVKQLLSQPLLRWIGTRSYGLYLWHWPIFVVTRPGLDLGLEGLSALGLRLGLSFVVAELSYRLIEEPVRSGRLFAWLRARRVQRDVPRPVLATAVLLTLGCMWVTRGFVQALPPAEPRWEHLAQPESTQLALTGQVPTALSRKAEEHNTHAEHERAAGSPRRVLIFGDSVVLGAKHSLLDGHEDYIEVDSEIGRTSSTALPRLRKLKRQRKLRPVMIVHLGNNGWLYEEHVHEMMELFAEVERVVFVTARVPKRWQDRNNAILARALEQHPRAVLVDFCKESEGHREWFGVDGLHLTHAGAKAFADLLAPYYRE